jgi:hypothetical protein
MSGDEDEPDIIMLSRSRGVLISAETAVNSPDAFMRTTTALKT